MRTVCEDSPLMESSEESICVAITWPLYRSSTTKWYT